MLNNEVGLYSIVAALRENPDAAIVFNGDKVSMKLNGEVVVGNRAILEDFFPSLNAKDELEDVIVDRKRDRVTILDEDFAIVYDEDWTNLMEDPAEIMKEVDRYAHEEEKITEDDSAFAFDDDGDDEF